MPSYGYREHSEPPRALRFLRNRKLTVLIGAVVVTFFLVTFSNKGLLRRVLLERELDGKRANVAMLRESIRELRQTRNDLAGDRFTIERVAREAHGMVKPGEIVYRIRPARSTPRPGH